MGLDLQRQICQSVSCLFSFFFQISVSIALIWQCFPSLIRALEEGMHLPRSKHLQYYECSEQVMFELFVL